MKYVINLDFEIVNSTGCPFVRYTNNTQYVELSRTRPMSGVSRIESTEARCMLNNNLISYPTTAKSKPFCLLEEYKSNSKEV